LAVFLLISGPDVLFGSQRKRDPERASRGHTAGAVHAICIINYELIPRKRNRNAQSRYQLETRAQLPTRAYGAANRKPDSVRGYWHNAQASSGKLADLKPAACGRPEVSQSLVRTREHAAQDKIEFAAPAVIGYAGLLGGEKRTQRDQA
jgi:hypothetical protein